jgi:hypothetical protein
MKAMPSFVKRPLVFTNATAYFSAWLANICGMPSFSLTIIATRLFANFLSSQRPRRGKILSDHREFLKDVISDIDEV